MMNEDLKSAAEAQTLATAAQRQLTEGLDLLKEAVAVIEEAHISTDDFSAASLNSYMVPHLEGWILGSNPYDFSMDQLLESLDHFILNAPVEVE